MIVGFLPVRLNSKRVPRKSIRMMAGRPLIQYNLESMLQLGLDKVIVYCSDESVQDYLLPGAEFLKRDDGLDSDQTLGIDVWRSFQADTGADIIVQSHATAPFIRIDSLREGISEIVDKGYDSASSVKEIRTYCWYENEPLNFSRENIIQTQQLQPVLVETGGFYIWRKEVLDTQHSRISSNHSFVTIAEVESIDIDYEDDFTLAELIAKGMQAS